MIYLLGYLLALSNGASFIMGKFVLGYVVFGCAHLSVSFSNDYFDRKSDANSIRTAFSGGSKVLVEYPQLETLALKTAIILVAASAIAAALFTFIFDYSFWFLVFAILGGLLGWSYTAPPLKFAYRKLGEVATVIAVGLMMPGIGYFSDCGSIDLFFAVFVFPLGCYGLSFILTVEMPDIDSDRAGGKINALVKWGVKKGLGISFVSALAGSVSLAVIHFSGILMGKLDAGRFAIFSALPLAGVATGLYNNLNSRQSLVRQGVINMTTMVLFLLLLDADIFAQVAI
jgi:1,4-dihydroxy-2-naphthoate octaprenyltransferase